MSHDALMSETADASPSDPEAACRGRSRPGGSRELLTLALPLVVSQSFMTAQVFADTLLLARHDPLEMAASFPAMMWFWLPFGLLQATAAYVATFVAQYTGAGRPHRVGPAVWQGVHFAVVAGLLFLLVVPAAPSLIALGGHTPALQALEVTYLRCLSFAALPMLVMAAINGFFSGRGQTWTVLGIEVAGTAINIAGGMLLISGRLGFPEWGIAGAGWSTVAGSWVSAMVALVLFLRPRFAREFRTLAGWRPERELFGRLLRYGLPAGSQVLSDVLVFHVFVQLVGRLGEAQAGATALTVRLNMVAFLPMLGMVQAVSILVGQRLGGERPDLAIPSVMVSVFEGESDPTRFAAVAELVPALLAMAAAYSVADGANMTFAFALRGAGDTRFVSVLTFLLAWPIMVVPTFLLVRSGGGIEWAWAFATAYILAMAACFSLRFRSGKWKGMRVIEAVVAPAESPLGVESCSTRRGDLAGEIAT
jgi:MATE family multidrug resistance protein